MKIVVLDGFTLNPGDNPWNDVAALGELTVHDRTPAHKIVERAEGADIVLTNKTPLTAQTLAHFPALKLICVLATGFNVVDTAAARNRNIPVCNVPIYGTDSVAQFVFALLLEMCHHVAEHNQAVRNEWSTSADFCFWKNPLVELSGLKMGIVGFGRIGRRTADVAHALGMEVWAYDAVKGNDPDYKPFRWASLEELFEGCDVLSLHCPLTDTNKGMVNAALLKRMKKTAFLINTSRGPLINEADLADALNRGQLAGAAVDVVSSEPICPDNPLLKAKNIIITPHLAWATLAAQRRLMQITAQNIAAFQAGSPINVVN